MILDLIHSFRNDIYLLLSSVSFSLAFILILYSYYSFERHRRNTLLLSMIFLFHALAISLLTLVLGDDPIFNINILRPYISFFRFLQLITESIFLTCLIYTFSKYYSRGIDHDI